MIPLLSLLGTIGRFASSNIGAAIQNALGEEVEKIDKEGTVEGAKAMANAIKDHFSHRFPNSKHYSRSKVRHVFTRVYVNVPGVTRAYQDIDIYPKNAAFLCIPVHPDSKGKSPTQFDNLFKPKDHNILAKNENGSLIVYYALSQHVHQKQDSTIMPTDEQLSKVAMEAMSKQLD